MPASFIPSDIIASTAAVRAYALAQGVDLATLESSEQRAWNDLPSHKDALKALGYRTAGAVPADLREWWATCRAVVGELVVMRDNGDGLLLELTAAARQEVLGVAHGQARN